MSGGKGPGSGVSPSVILTLILLFICCWGMLSHPVDGTTGAARDLFSRDEADSIRVPEGDGRPVLLDGTFSPGEWEDAKKLDIHPNVRLYLKKYRGHVFFGIQVTPYKTFVVDLFISPDGKNIHHLHTSAQICERFVHQDSGPWDNPEFIYGYSVGWYANEIRWDSRKQQALMKQGKSENEAQELSYFEYDGYEFQIRQSKFSSDQWLFRIEVPISPDWDKPIIYPDGTVMTTTDGWCRLELESQNTACDG